MKYLLVIFTVLLLAGCSDEQVRRAEAITDRAQQEVARAEEVVKNAEKLADAIGFEKAQPVIEQAKEALEAAKLTAKAAKDASDAAKSAHEAGSGTISTLFAGLMALLTGAATAAPAIMRAINTGRALTQTVQGIEKAKESMNAAEVAVLHSELAKAQDEKSKKLIKKAKV